MHVDWNCCFPLLKVDSHALWLLPFYAAIYLAVVLPFPRRPLWFDELLTC